MCICAVAVKQVFESGKCPKALFVSFPPLRRFRWMKIICPWCCLIRHLFQKGMHEMHTNMKTPSRFPSSRCMTVFHNCFTSLGKGIDDAHFNGYFWMRAHQRNQVPTTRSNVNTDTNGECSVSQHAANVMKCKHVHWNWIQFSTHKVP